MEAPIKLDRFVPRDYQLPILDAIENKGYKRVVAILPRRAGKDIVCWNAAIRACLRKPIVAFYCLPSFSHARRVIYDSVTNSGMRFLDYIPEELIASKNSQTMSIRFTNGSLLQLVGSDNYDSLVGTNPSFIVFSEYALADDQAFSYMRPALVANNGVACFISTPRGHNHLYDMYKMALNSDDWFAYKLSVEDTKHISIKEIEKERDDGLISEDMIQQEYYCSFDMGIMGSFYSRYIDKMRVSGQIGRVPWNSSCRVFTVWDLGVRDSTTIIFFQVIGQTVNIIDCYSNSKQGLEHYADLIRSKPYNYSKHFAPHDIKVQEWGSGMTRIEKARQLGINFSITPDVGVLDGIEAVRSSFGKIWIDELQCAPLIKALENYRQEFDSKKKVYMSKPLHDWSSDFADAMRYLCINLPRTADGLSAEQIEKNYQEAMYGRNNNMPSMFQGNGPSGPFGF